MPVEYLITLCAVAVLVLLHQRDRKICRSQRASFFDDARDLLQSYRIEQAGVAYPVLRGRYKGFDVRLEPIIDNMGWRKLPSLLLDVTVLSPTGFPAAVDLLMRPNGNEVYSRIWQMDRVEQLPKAWPQDALLRTEGADVGSTELDALTPYVSQFSDPTWKEMVVTPKGVRFVRIVDECSRAHYVAFRELKFSLDAEPGLVRETLDTALALIASLPAQVQLKVA